MDEGGMTLDPGLFLPEPEPAPIHCTLISVDDHLVEPAHKFEGRLPADLQPDAPSIVETPEGHQVWEFEGQLSTRVGTNAVAGRRPDTVKIEPFRFEHMRPGCYDPKARIGDMDLIGTWASMNFPSQITGFYGRVFFAARNHDPTLVLPASRHGMPFQTESAWTRRGRCGSSTPSGTASSECSGEEPSPIP